MKTDIVAEVKQFLKEEHNLRTTAGSINETHLPAHPKELELELSETEDYVSQVYNKLISESTLKDVKEVIVEDAHDDLQDHVLKSLEDSQTDKKKKADQYKIQLQQLEHTIYSFADSIEKDNNLMKAFHEEATRHLDDTMTMEKELERQRQTLSQTPACTAEEAHETMDKIMAEMSDLLAFHEKKQYSTAEKSSKLSTVEREITHLKAEREFLSAKTQVLSYSNRQKADQTVVDKFQGYEKYTELAYRQGKIEGINRESNGDLKVVYALPYDTELRISFDNEREVITSVKTTGDIVHIEDVVESAKKMNIYNGIELIIVETLFRLKNKVEL